MNVELLQRIKAHILENPLRIYMDDWILKLDKGKEYANRGRFRLFAPPCGTVACICGWAVELSGHDSRISRAGQTGKLLLELDGDSCLFSQDVPSEAQRLFYAIYWPKEFRRRLQEAPVQSMEYAQVVADRIDHFIQTGGAE